ncbi:eukaryotic translation elongation factor 1 epsilon-1 [Diachasma alloeum]|uniref:eukaryotic translation elongation factor 1 epsilon-1 n=1 Tax=Diachasma alloeum TaxID=454923 RepID=UPI0007384B78|nr:eukaryotic translation elongation factor 1 epsilon-1 [Diachasma alloeum]
MVLCSIECVQRISQYLEIPPGKLQITQSNTIAADNLVKNTTIEGFSSIIQAYANLSKQQELHLGSDRITQTLVRQWLEYAVMCVNYADIPANTKRVLKELNIALRDNTYITGTSKTIADVALYYALHSIMSGLTCQEQAEYVHVSRWFDNVQQEAKLRHKLKVIDFDLMHLYI